VDRVEEVNMPNIEIHGCNLDFARGLRIAIFGAFKAKKVIKKMVVTIACDDVEDHKGAKRPFLRIFNSEEDQEARDRVVEILKNGLCMDIEDVPPIKFFPEDLSTGKIKNG